MLTFDQRNQVPPSYLNPIGYHLGTIAEHPSAIPYQKALATQLLKTLNALIDQFQHIRTDVKNLLAMNDSQLLQPGVLDSLVKEVTTVYKGKIDATTDKVQHQRVVQLYQALQTLATFEVQPYT